ncbi:MAG: hypothetical protein KTU85_01795 [Acidimicrobiia bacterium]|nr:hypothetical protein [Acidimicrobiia bacterium]
MFDSMISQTRQVVTVGRSRGELEGLLAGSAGLSRWRGSLSPTNRGWRVWLLALHGLWPR